jgi:hypothetical protein
MTELWTFSKKEKEYEIENENDDEDPLIPKKKKIKCKECYCVHSYNAPMYGQKRTDTCKYHHST